MVRADGSIVVTKGQSIRPGNDEAERLQAQIKEPGPNSVAEKYQWLYDEGVGAEAVALPDPAVAKTSGT